jgi:DNA-binding Xre family transcriptional regulator
MALFNLIGQFIEKRGITCYRFWQDTGIGRDTAYRLYKDPSYIPSGVVLEKICSTYKLQPGEFLEWRDDKASVPEGTHATPSVNEKSEIPSSATEKESDPVIEAMVAFRYRKFTKKCG